jgi:transcriptional regulator with XRE-family HTH domain
MSPERLTLTLQEAIRDSGLSLKALAERAGMDIGQLSRFMRNERTITLPAAAKLCAVLGLELKPRKREGK